MSNAVLLRGSLILDIVAPEESGSSIQEWPPVQLFPGAMILALMRFDSEKGEKGVNSQLLRPRLANCIDGYLVICQYKACGHTMRLSLISPFSLYPLLNHFSISGYTKDTHLVHQPKIILLLFVNLPASSLQNAPNCAVVAAFGSLEFPIMLPVMGCCEGSLYRM